jgi:hypothetical protein
MHVTSSCPLNSVPPEAVSSVVINSPSVSSSEIYSTQLCRGIYHGRSRRTRARILLADADLLHEFAVVPEQVFLEHDAVLVPVANSGHGNAVGLAGGRDGLSI